MSPDPLFLFAPYLRCLAKARRDLERATPVLGAQTTDTSQLETDMVSISHWGLHKKEIVK